MSSLRIRESKFVHEPFKSGISVSDIPLALPVVSPSCFQSPILWGLILEQVPWGGCLIWDADPFLLWGELCGCDSPPAVVKGVDYTVSLPLFSSQCGLFFISLLIENLFIFRDSCSCSCCFGVFVGGNKFGIFLLCDLDLDLIKSN